MYFHYSKHKNYQIEAFNLLAGVNAPLTPCIAHQVTWSRFINTSGGKGKNISLDLHMEHLNRMVKDYVVNLGANVAEKSIIQCGQSLKGLLETCGNFDQQMQVVSSIKHTRSSDTKDETIILKELIDKSHVFNYTPGRTHPSFKAIQPSIAEHVNTPKLVDWIKGKKEQMQQSISTARGFKHFV